MKDYYVIEMIVYGIGLAAFTTLLALIVLPIVLYVSGIGYFIGTIIPFIGMYSSIIYSIANDIKKYKRLN